MRNRTIVYTVDGGADALKWLEWSLASARRVLGDGVRIVVCTDTPRDFGHGAECVDVRGDIERYGISRISELEWYGKPVTPMQVFRLALPLVGALREEDRIVFVDADTEFVDARWAELFDVSAEGCDVLGVRDGECNRFIEQRHKAFVTSDVVKAEIADNRLRVIRDERFYVNGGVLVMDLARLRTNYDYAETVRKMIDFCVRAKLQFLDQDAINLFFRVGMIPSRFNDSPALHAPGQPAWLRHYTGKEKWKAKVYPPIRYSLLRAEYPRDRTVCTSNGRVVAVDGQPAYDNKVPVVYVVGKPNEHDDQELRWSLRSIAKYGRNVGRVIVTSPCRREWLSDAVEQIEVPDLVAVGYKHHNILHAILQTVDLAKLDGEFSVSSDDHFWVRPVDFAAQPMVAQHWTIPKYGAAKSVGTMLWMQSCTDTREFLYQHDLPTIDFQMHRNARWHAGLVREHINLFKEAMTWRFCVEPHVLAQNLWVHTQPDTEVVFRHDYKLKEFHGLETDCDCISCFDSAFDDKAFMGFMGEEFGEKCRYEK